MVCRGSLRERVLVISIVSSAGEAAGKPQSVLLLALLASEAGNKGTASPQTGLCRVGNATSAFALGKGGENRVVISVSLGSLSISSHPSLNKHNTIHIVRRAVPVTSPCRHQACRQPTLISLSPVDDHVTTSLSHARASCADVFETIWQCVRAISSHALSRRRILLFCVRCKSMLIIGCCQNFGIDERSHEGACLHENTRIIARLTKNDIR